MTRKKIKSAYMYNLQLSTVHGIRTILPATGFLQRPRTPRWPSFSALGIRQAEL